jgi:ArsR family transcriptional regulator
MVLRDYPEGMSDIFDVLADGTRRDILRRLLDGDAGASDLADALGVTPPTVAKHLSRLVDAGLVTVHGEGRARSYALRTAPLDVVDAWLSPFLGGVSASATATDDAAGATIFAAWAGTDAGDRVGRVAADAAHNARVALDAAQEKLQGAQKRVAEKLPRWGRES